MIYDIVISDQAEIDLRGIFEYIAFELSHQKMQVVSLIGLKHVFYLVLYIPDDDTNLFLPISARITIYDLLYRDFRLGRDRPSWNLRIHCF